MAIILPHEAGTKVEGADGLIRITQRRSDGKEVLVYLTVHQFREIWNHEKHLIAEAEALEKDEKS